MVYSRRTVEVGNNPQKTAEYRRDSGHLESQIQGSKLQELAKDNGNKRPTVYNPNLKSPTTINNFILQSTQLWQTVEIFKPSYPSQVNFLKGKDLTFLQKIQ